MHSEELDRDIAGAVAAHQRLLATVEDLTDAEVWGPSLLPGWTRGHVLSHLARNADSFVRIMRGAENGEALTQYEGGSAGRAADIEAGVPRSAEITVADLRMSIWKLEQSWDNATDRGWSGSGTSLAGDVPTVDLPHRRWGEVEIHHVDLDLGYSAADWPSDFVRLELKRFTSYWASRQPMGLAELPAAVLRLTPNERLEWLVGRREVEGVAPAGVY